MATESNKTVLNRSSSSRYCLKVVDASGIAKVYRLVGQAVRIGRGQSNDIVIDDRNLSRSHAVILIRESGCMIKDLESRNGLYVNAKKKKESPLKHEDLIQLGDTEIVFIENDQVIDLQGEGKPAIASIEAGTQLDEAVYDGSAPLGGLNAEGSVGIKLQSGEGRLKRFLQGPYGKYVKLGAVAVVVFGFFSGFVILKVMQQKQQMQKEAQASTSSQADAAPSPPSEEIGYKPPKSVEERLGRIRRELMSLKTPDLIYQKCLDYEDLAYYREALLCYETVSELPGSEVGVKRTTQKMNEAAQTLYREGLRLFEVEYLENARLKWQQVILLTPETNDYHIQARKGLASIEKRLASTN